MTSLPIQVRSIEPGRMVGAACGNGCAQRVRIVRRIIRRQPVQHDAHDDRGRRSSEKPEKE